jgi:hypothetical protein
MSSHRPTARAILFLLVLWVVIATPGLARAGAPPEKIVFPVVGDVSYTDDFGAPRGQGRHEGNDLMGERHQPVVAAEAGRIKLWTTSWRAGCMLYLYGRSGTTYYYIHLNNDLTDRNDNRGSCVEGVAYAPGLRDGQSVRAGQLIAYVGDSGDANGIQPHLHFELHPEGSGATSPYPWLQEARHLLYAVPEPAAMTTLAATGGPALVLYGTVVAAGDGELSVRVRRVRISTGEAYDVSKAVTLAVGAAARLQRSAGRTRESSSLGDARAGEDVVVWTAPVDGSLESQLGARGSIAAAQVLFRG